MLGLSDVLNFEWLMLRQYRFQTRQSSSSWRYHGAGFQMGHSKVLAGHSYTQAQSSLYEVLDPGRSSANIKSQMIFHIALLKMPLYTDITGRMVVYWFANIGVCP